MNVTHKDPPDPAPQGVSGDGGEAKPKFEAGQRFAGHAFGQAISVTLKEAHLIDPGDDEAPFWVWSIETQLGGGGSLSEEVLASEYEPIPPDPSEALKARVCVALGVTVPFDTDLEEAVDQLVEEATQILPAATQNQSTDTVPSGGVESDEAERIKLAKWLRERASEELRQRNGATLAEVADLHQESALQLIAAAAVVERVSLLQRQRDSRLTKEQSDSLLDALLVVVLGWESGPLDKLVDELGSEEGGQEIEERIDSRVEDIFGRKLVANRRDITDEVETSPTDAGIEFVRDRLRATFRADQPSKGGEQ